MGFRRGLLLRSELRPFSLDLRSRRFQVPLPLAGSPPRDRHRCVIRCARSRPGWPWPGTPGSRCGSGPVAAALQGVDRLGGGCLGWCGRCRVSGGGSDQELIAPRTFRTPRACGRRPSLRRSEIPHGPIDRARRPRRRDLPNANEPERGPRSSRKLGEHLRVRVRFYPLLHEPASGLEGPRPGALSARF
jgi:hypothetical protein